MVFFMFSCRSEFTPGIICLPPEELYKHFSSAGLLADCSFQFLFIENVLILLKSLKGIFAGYRILIVLFCSFACFTTFSSLNDPTPLHPRLSVCSFLSLDNSLTSSSYHRLILISLVSFHASQRPLLTMLSKTSLLLCDCLIFLFTPCAILP